VRLYLQSGGRPVNERAREAQKDLQVNTIWWIKRVMSLTTSSREFTALHSCRNLPLISSILQPSSPSSSSSSSLSSSSFNNDSALPGVLGSIFKSKFNPSQLKAIEAATTSKGFALLQGPPGTGKTRTIIGLISALLLLPPSSILTASSLHKGFSTRKEPPKKNKVHILVCAPSNAAVDEIVLRLSEGVWDREGALYKPSIVRVGNPAHVHPLARKFCSEYILEQKWRMKIASLMWNAGR
jgi:senataxin